MNNNKDWRNTGKHGMYVINGASNHSDKERQQHDYYATDPQCMERLLQVEEFSHNVWEPACGEGHLSGVLKAHGHEVRESDIVDRMGNEVLDFLSGSGSWLGDIVTNPPYAMAKDFVEKALDVVEEGRKVAMFLKLTFLEGKGRQSLFSVAPPNACMSLPTGRSVPQMATSRLLSPAQYAMHGLCG